MRSSWITLQTGSTLRFAFIPLICVATVFASIRNLRFAAIFSLSDSAWVVVPLFEDVGPSLSHLQ
jgi:hypothetical protein